MKQVSSQAFWRSAPAPFAIIRVRRPAGERKSSSRVLVVRSKERCQALWTREKKKAYARVPVARKARRRSGSAASGQFSAAPEAVATGRSV